MIHIQIRACLKWASSFYSSFPPIVFALALFFLIQCNNESKRNDLVAFQSETVTLDSLDRPPFKYYKYSSYFIDSNRITLTYVYDDTILHLLDWESGKSSYFRLPKSKSEDNTSISIFRTEGRLFMVRHPGEVFELDENGFKLVRDFKQISRFVCDGLKMDYQINTGNYVSCYKDSLMILPLNLTLTKGAKYKTIFEPYPLYALVNLNSWKIRYLNYSAPEHYLRHDHYIRDCFQGTLAGDNLIISYAYSPFVEIYSLKANKLLEKKELRSNFQVADISDFPSDMDSPEARHRYSVQSAYYGSLVFNPYLKQYYRVFYSELPEKLPNGDYTILNDKHISVVVFDREFKFLGEYVFPEEVNFVLGISPTKQGFVVNSSIRESEGGILITKIKIIKT